RSSFGSHALHTSPKAPRPRRCFKLNLPQLPGDASPARAPTTLDVASARPAREPGGERARKAQVPGHREGVASAEGPLDIVPPQVLAVRDAQGDLLEGHCASSAAIQRASRRSARETAMRAADRES